MSGSLYFCKLLFETMPRRNDAWDHWYDDLGVSTGRLQAPIFEHKDVRVILHVVERRVLDEHDGI